MKVVEAIVIINKIIIKIIYKCRTSEKIKTSKNFSNLHNSNYNSQILINNNFTKQIIKLHLITSNNNN